jgi:hypothetical protein
MVRITLNGNGLPVANPDPAPARKGIQKVQWSAAFPFTISFKGAPDLPSAPSPGGYDAQSGVFNQPLHDKVKYSITANGQTNDPEVEIVP